MRRSTPVTTLPHSSDLASVEDYLAEELRAESRHEYLGGLGAIAELPELALRLPLAELYERLRF